MERTNVESFLKKEITFLGLVASFVAINIGGALFSLTVVAGSSAGPSLPIAMLVASVPAILALVPYSMFSTAWPTTSSTYRYSQLLSPPLAFIHMFTLLLCMLIGAEPLFALTFGEYFNLLMPETAQINPAIIGIIVFTLFYIVNLLGIKFTTRLQIFLFLTMMAALVLFVIFGIDDVKTANFSPLMPNGAIGFVGVIGILFTFCAGGLFVIDLGGEVKRAAATYRRALITGMLTVVIIYVLIHVVTVGAVNWEALKEQRTLMKVAENFMPGWAVLFFIIGGALVACATTINGIFTIISRGMMVIAEEGLFPAFLGKVSKRFGTPHWALTFIWAVCSLSLYILTSPMAKEMGGNPVFLFGVITNFGLIISITFVCIAGAVVPFQMNKVYEKSGFKISKKVVAFISGSAVFLNALILTLLLLALQKAMGYKPAVMLGVFVLIAVITYLVSRWNMTRKGLTPPGKPTIPDTTE
ncbi:MAG: amino acid permease [Deltaproteobacteria bacterium]|nr:amino acid permease [Candidatus Zymogenaceae bacterium]